MLAVSSTMLTDDSFLQVLNPTLQNQVLLLNKTNKQPFLSLK